MATMGGDASRFQLAVNAGFPGHHDEELAFADDYTHGQFMATNIVSLCLGAMSVASAVLAFYLFLQMRRNFRHDLIMLLIQSDMFKSICFTVFPIVTLVRGPIASSSTFCQASGFLLTAGIEASDIAVLLIALHTGLTIFRPRHTGGERGLFPYRRLAYLAWAIVPLIIASLAFVRGPVGYKSDGKFCYLPAYPEWSRLALSWVPRYIIFATIILTYGYVYCYVMVLVHRFGKVGGARNPEQQNGCSRGSRRTWRPGIRESTFVGPPVPPIDYHGLVPPTPPSRRASILSAVLNATTSRRSSTTRSNGSNGSSGGTGAAGSAEGNPLMRMSGRIIGYHVGSCWKWPSLSPKGATRPLLERPASSNPGADLPSPDIPPSDIPPPDRARIALDDTPSPSSPSSSSPPSFSPPSTEPTNIGDLTVPRPTRLSTPRRASSSTPASNVPPDPAPAASTVPTAFSSDGANHTSILGPDPFPPRSSSDPHSLHHAITSSSATSLSSISDAVIFLSPSASDVSGLAKTREKIRRQVRLMFVYPLVYILVWITPLVANVYRWHNWPRTTPFALSLLSMSSLCIQGVVNAGLFSIREKPWRHRSSKQGRGGNSSSANGSTSGDRRRRSVRGPGTSKFGGWGWPGARRGHGSGPGRTREEMMADERMARRRRLGEEHEERDLEVGQSGERRRRVRDWWDIEEERMGE